MNQEQKDHLCWTYKTLIIITAGISLFFFGRYVYQKWPRYEWKESIFHADWNEFYSLTPSTKKVYCTDPEAVYPALKKIYSLKEGETYCYIKEKIRIN